MSFTVGLGTFLQADSLTMALYIGMLTPAKSASDGACVEAVPAPRLIPCVPPAVHGAVSVTAGPRARVPDKVKPKRKKKDYTLIYYVCTHDSCGWRGASLSKHHKQKPTCVYHPSSFHYDRGASAKDAAAAFLASCTPTQRKYGLPPDFAKPVPVMGPNGRFNPQQLYLTVPMGMKAGNSFTVPMGHGMEARITVPEGKAEGDVLALSAHAGRKTSAKRRANEAIAATSAAGAATLPSDAAGHHEEGGATGNAGPPAAFHVAAADVVLSAVADAEGDADGDDDEDEEGEVDDPGV